MGSGKGPNPKSSFDIMLAVESLVLAGLGVGLASVAGVRAFVPLALCGLFATMYGTGGPLGAVPGLAAGSAIAALVAVLGVVLRPRSGGSSAGVSTAFLSAMEDVVAVLGGILGIFLPFVPVLLVGFLLFFFHRIRKRRGRKYGGLRILGD